MWEKLRIRVRDRLLGILFLSSLAAVFGYGVLALFFPHAALVAVGISFLAAFCLFVVRRQVWLRRNKYGSAPVGPLSSDEKLKARSKLLQARRQNGRSP
jgi:hypothetical protein